MAAFSPVATSSAIRPAAATIPGPPPAASLPSSSGGRARRHPTPSLNAGEVTMQQLRPQAGDADEDQIDCDYEVQQPGHDQDQDAGNERNERLQGDGADDHGKCLLRCCDSLK